MGKGLPVSCVRYEKKLQLLKIVILMKIITFKNHLIKIHWQFFRYRAKNYKSNHHTLTNKKHVPKEALKQKIFHEHFCSDDCNGIQD